jgi:hypothetical protein
LALVAADPAFSVGATGGNDNAFEAGSPGPFGAESFQRMIERLTVTARRRAPFGKNTVGGPISVTTRKAHFALGGSAELRAGAFGTFETRDRSGASPPAHFRRDASAARLPRTRGF